MRDPLARENSCDGKVIYLSKKAASIAAALLTKKSKGRKPLTPYKCKHCNKYHFGHTKAKTDIKQPAKQQRQKLKLDPKDYGITRGFRIYPRNDPFAE